jgi:hypothetical protein
VKFEVTILIPAVSAHVEQRELTGPAAMKSPGQLPLPARVKSGTPRRSEQRLPEASRAHRRPITQRHLCGLMTAK